ncbi:MAG: nucleotidyltransferase family protein [Clostridia bacterium]|nr:nucleotidyltransferase family protein [Clostridia bacterium]
MKIGGIIAEYNPFHNGHAFQLSQVKAECDAVVAVMSGSVVQRGSIAAYDKFMRARAAVLSGVDLVLELPCVYTLAPAELFAKGAVGVLDATKVVTDLYFGSECGDTYSLTRAAEIMLAEPPEVSARIKEYLRMGKGYKQATLEAYLGVIPAELVNLPNNLLGIEYIKSIIRSGSKIEPHALLRQFANHNDTSPSNGFASGNTIRDILDEKKDISAYVPPITYALYERAKPVDRKLYDAIVLYMLRLKGMKEFNRVFDASPDLVSRILRSIPDSTSVDDIITKSYSRQFSNARIRRAILSMLLEIDGELVNSAPQYLRVLAFNDKGREILNKIGKKSKLPIITKAADFKEPSPMFEAEVRATELSSVCRGVKRGIDFVTSPYYITEARYQITDFPKPPIPPHHTMKITPEEKAAARRAALKEQKKAQKKKKYKKKPAAKKKAAKPAENKAE